MAVINRSIKVYLHFSIVVFDSWHFPLDRSDSSKVRIRAGSLKLTSTAQ
jgi:hypothetical protein